MLRLIELAAGDPAPPAAETGVPALDPAERLQSEPDCHLLVVDDNGRLRARASCWWRAVPTLPGERPGLVGHYAALDEEAAAMVLEAACTRLAREGCTVAIGPMDGSTWRRYRFVVERGNEPPFFLEPDNPDAYPRQFEAAGFGTLATYTSALNTDLSQEDSPLDPLVERFAARGIRIRPLEPASADTALRRIFALSLESFANNFLYTPFPEAEFLEANRRLLPVLRPELVLLAEHDGGLAGFLFALPDVLELKRVGRASTFIIKTVAVAAGRQQAGLGRLLVGLAHREGRRLGFTRAIHALMHEDNVSRNISRRSAATMRRYALFSKPLDAGGPGDRAVR
jgi:GNAT superfamily N-acetyltransferase